MMSEEHLALRVRSLLLDLPEPLPGIFSEETEAAVKGRAAPALDGIVTALVDDRQYLLERAEGKSRSDKTLVRVSQNRFGEIDLFLHGFPPSLPAQPAVCKILYININIIV